MKKLVLFLLLFSSCTSTKTVSELRIKELEYEVEELQKALELQNKTILHIVRLNQQTLTIYKNKLKNE